MSDTHARLRVLAQLRRGPVRQSDFNLPTIDGGKAIGRVAPRIAELRAAGFLIETGRRRGSRAGIYTLISEPLDASLVDTAPPQAPAKKKAAPRKKRRKRVDPLEAARIPMWEDYA